MNCLDLIDNLKDLKIIIDNIEKTYHNKGLKIKEMEEMI